MPKKVARALSDVAVRTAAPGRHADGSGLHLVVKPSGARAWVLRVVYRGRRRDIGLGGYPEVSLAAARRKAEATRAHIADGLDPIAERAKARVSGLTFQEAAERLIAAKRPEWRNEKHAAQWASTLRTYAFPVIGRLDVKDVTTEHVLKVLTPVWTTKTETATRLRQRIEAVLDYATAIKARAGDNPAAWRGNLQAALPKASKVKTVVHHAALPWQDLGSFMAELASAQGMGAKALRFAILTAARSGEVRGATWAEIDLRAKVWTVPAARMKARREHRVPLSAAAVDLLRSVAGTDEPEPAALVFPGTARSKPLSDMTLTAVLKRMGRGDLTVHGFRSTFRDWAGEATNFPRELAEKALAHTINNAVEAAYARGDLFEKRRKLMEGWAAFCARPAMASDVLPIRGKGAR